MPLTFEQAVELRDTYRSTDPETLRKLGTITLAAFVGPTAVGKNFNMASTGYRSAGTITTRERRGSDPHNYRYVTKPEFLTMIKQGTLVQYDAIPETRTFYGSDADDYEADTTHVMDVTYHGTELLARQGFGAVRPIGVVAYPDEWEVRLDHRFNSMLAHNIDGRLAEAELSLRAIRCWGRRHDRLLIVSSDTLSRHNRDAIRDFVRTGRTGDNRSAQKVCDDMLEAIPYIHRRFLGE